mmetsp:Transcript_10035/g.22497  ORF Transcript_10035/g.22497 Transcript_10035/m.22497 type:complete len:217 (-) Transcript_10035:7-657(-)
MSRQWHHITFLGQLLPRHLGLGANFDLFPDGVSCGNTVEVANLEVAGRGEGNQTLHTRRLRVPTYTSGASVEPVKASRELQTAPLALCKLLGPHANLQKLRVDVTQGLRRLLDAIAGGHGTRASVFRLSAHSSMELLRRRLALAKPAVGCSYLLLQVLAPLRYGATPLLHCAASLGICLRCLAEELPLFLAVAAASSEIMAFRHRDPGTRCEVREG